jgi:hypothetical protein
MPTWTRAQPGNAHAHLDAGAQFVGVERLDQVVVGARIEPANHVGATVARGGEDDVDVRVRRRLADVPADFGAVERRHHPVEHGDRRRVGRHQCPQGRVAVEGHRHVESAALERASHEQNVGAIVVGDQRAHGDTARA